MNFGNLVLYYNDFKPLHVDTNNIKYHHARSSNYRKWWVKVLYEHKWSEIDDRDYGYSADVITRHAHKFLWHEAV